MALSDDQIIETKHTPARLKYEIVDGAITIYKGAILGFESGNIGFVQLGQDSLTDEFAGIALENKTLAAADNGSDGDNEVEVIPRGSGELIKMTVTSSVTRANIGDPVYMDDDDSVDLAAGVTNTTGGFVGIIRQVVDTSTAWVQLTQHPIL